MWNGAFAAGGRFAPGGYFSLSDLVGARRPNRREDVIKIQTALGNSGHLDLMRTKGPTGYFGLVEDKAVRDFQKESGLKIDGWLRPGGETIRGLERKTGNLLQGFTPPSPEEVDKHFADLGKGGKGLLSLGNDAPALRRPKDLPALTAEASAASQRLTRGLLATGNDGDLPMLTAEAMQSGQRGMAEVFDLIDQISASDPARAQSFTAQMFRHLPDRLREELGGDAARSYPLGVFRTTEHRGESGPVRAEPAVVRNAQPATAQLMNAAAGNPKEGGKAGDVGTAGPSAKSPGKGASRKPGLPDLPGRPEDFDSDQDRAISQQFYKFLGEEFRSTDKLPQTLSEDVLAAVQSGDAGQMNKAMHVMMTAMSANPKLFEQFPAETRSAYEQFMSSSRSQYHATEAPPGVQRERNRVAHQRGQEGGASHYTGTATAKGAVDSAEDVAQGLQTLLGASDKSHAAREKAFDKLRQGQKIPPGYERTRTIQNAKRLGELAPEAVIAIPAIRAAGAVGKTVGKLDKITGTAATSASAAQVAGAAAKTAEDAGLDRNGQRLAAVAGLAANKAAGDKTQALMLRWFKKNLPPEFLVSAGWLAEKAAEAGVKRGIEGFRDRSE